MGAPRPIVPAFNAPAPGVIRRRVSVGLSVVVHALALWLIPAPQPPPVEQVLEVAFVQRGEPGPEGGPQDTEDPSETPTLEPPSEDTTPTETPPQEADDTPPEPDGGAFSALARARQGTRPPNLRSAPAPSYRDWQRQQQQAAAFAPSLPKGGGLPDGEDLMSQRGRDRCEPPPHRRAPGFVFLLFDSSGSMNQLRQAQALSCAHQYARFAIESGAEVVVANFARDVTFYPATRRMLDVEAALRGGSDKTATVLPARELQPFFDKAVGQAADLVIVSDGWFETPKDVQVWYRYFLEMNVDNRGLMFTVGAPGHQAATGPLRELGFDVYIYEQLARR